MKKFLGPILGIIVASILVGWVVKETKTNEPITFIASPNGTPTPVAVIGVNGTMQVDAVANKAGTGHPTFSYGANIGASSQIYVMSVPSTNTGDTSCGNSSYGGACVSCTDSTQTTRVCTFTGNTRKCLCLRY